MAVEIFDLVVYTIDKANKIFVDKNEYSFGKTMLQKSIYFALPIDERYEYYIPYHYGPYSDLVQRSIGDLYYHEFIENSKENINFIVFNDEKTKRSKVESYINKHSSELLFFKDRIDKVLNFIYEKKISVKEISLSGKIHIIKERIFDNNISPSQDDIKKKSSYFGWHNEIRGIRENDYIKYDSIINNITKLFDN